MPYDVAQICLNGHEINPCTAQIPAHSKDYCDKCGEKTITNCPKCNGRIRGLLIDGMGWRYQAPAHCDHCGAAFPWTETKTQAAIELFVEEANLDEQEAKDFAQSVQEVVRETPRTPLAASRISRALKKVSQSTAEAFSQHFGAGIERGGKEGNLAALSSFSAL